MKNYLAPMEGVTNWVYRNAYHDCFYPMDKYFTPFITAKPNKRLSSKEIKEVSPETNGDLPVIPQILTNNAEDFVKTAHIFRDEYGHREVNLNLGCPSGTVTAKGKGAGFLGEPDKLERFLDEIFEKTGMEISIKTRVGTDYEEDWERLLEIYGRYPLKELIIHPRLLKDHYKGVPRYGLYEEAREKLKVPLGYNGDIFSVEAYQEIREKFPDADSVMYGRGLIARPYLLDAIMQKEDGEDHREEYRKKLRQFHDRLYRDYQEYLSGERNVLFRMKELWSYMAPGFTNYARYQPFWRTGDLKGMNSIKEKFDEFISQYPIFEYRVLDTGDIKVQSRVRTICKQECERYGSTWACPPAVGELSECEKKIRSYPKAVFFSSVAEVSDIMNMKEMLSTRMEHEALTEKVRDFLEGEGYETFTLSTESCDFCERCAYLDGKPCRFPEHMHPCLESYGVVVSEIVEKEAMEYNLGGNTILWFSMVLIRR